MLRNPHTTDTMFLTVTWKVLTPDMALAMPRLRSQSLEQTILLLVVEDTSLSLKGDQVKLVNRETPE